jgi:hypothetical protein
LLAFADFIGFGDSHMRSCLQRAHGFGATPIGDNPFEGFTFQDRILHGRAWSSSWKLTELWKPVTNALVELAKSTIRCNSIITKQLQS